MTSGALNPKVSPLTYLGTHATPGGDLRLSQAPKVGLLYGESLPRSTSEPSSFVLWVLGSCWKRGASAMGVATAPPPPTTSKTLQKQYLEAVGAYQYVLTFLFMGENRGGMGAWGLPGE